MVRSLLVVLQAVLGLLVLLVLSIAFRSYRRSEEPFLGWTFAGFVAIGTGAFADGAVRRLVPDRAVVASVETVLFVVGFGLILFALRR